MPLGLVIGKDLWTVVAKTPRTENVCGSRKNARKELRAVLENTPGSRLVGSSREHPGHKACRWFMGTPWEQNLKVVLKNTSGTRFVGSSEEHPGRSGNTLGTRLAGSSWEHPGNKSCRRFQGTSWEQGL